MTYKHNGLQGQLQKPFFLTMKYLMGIVRYYEKIRPKITQKNKNKKSCNYLYCIEKMLAYEISKERC
jgi:hypothetical protein